MANFNTVMTSTQSTIISTVAFQQFNRVNDVLRVSIQIWECNLRNLFTIHCFGPTEIVEDEFMYPCSIN